MLVIYNSCENAMEKVEGNSTEDAKILPLIF